MPVKLSTLALIISRLSKKFNFDRRLVYYQLVTRFSPSSHKALNELKHANIFFIVSTGRTGTQWLANLLNKAAGTYVVHEPVPNEWHNHAQVIMQPETAQEYLYTYRFREIALRMHEHPSQIYGEVNSALRFHICALRELLPKCKIIHLVRDGRAVVRSVMNRRLSSHRTPLYTQITPPIDDEYTARWHELSDFEKVCWGWQAENRFMRLNTELRARFEDITTSYELFSQQILKTLGLLIEEKTWLASLRVPMNQTKNHLMEPWKHWTREQKIQFITICSREMSHYGYEVREAHIEQNFSAVK
jgi:hypothetical protein